MAWSTGWQTPKTDWTSDNGISNSDLNRIESNITKLKLGMDERITVGTTDPPATGTPGYIYLKIIG
jgi:hypothetical protein